MKIQSPESLPPDAWPSVSLDTEIPPSSPTLAGLRTELPSPLTQPIHTKSPAAAPQSTADRKEHGSWDCPCTSRQCHYSGATSSSTSLSVSLEPWFLSKNLFLAMAQNVLFRPTAATQLHGGEWPPLTISVTVPKSTARFCPVCHHQGSTALQTARQGAHSVLTAMTGPACCPILSRPQSRPAQSGFHTPALL